MENNKKKDFVISFRLLTNEGLPAKYKIFLYEREINNRNVGSTIIIMKTCFSTQGYLLGECRKWKDKFFYKEEVVMKVNIFLMISKFAWLFENKGEEALRKEIINTTDSIKTNEDNKTDSINELKAISNLLKSYNAINRKLQTEMIWSAFNYLIDELIENPFNNKTKKQLINEACNFGMNEWIK